MCPKKIESPGLEKTSIRVLASACGVIWHIDSCQRDSGRTVVVSGAMGNAISKHLCTFGEIAATVVWRMFILWPMMLNPFAQGDPSVVQSGPACLSSCQVGNTVWQDDSVTAQKPKIGLHGNKINLADFSGVRTIF
ncbi:MAG: hypothetical protein HPY85_08535 [Anaerolineae bacterium]|nr:hypothetical protein [Anaerolineae bacterium]